MERLVVRAVVVGVVLGLAVLVVLRVRASSPAARAPATEEAGENGGEKAALEQQLAHLRGQVAALGSTVAQLRQQPASGAPASATAAGAAGTGAASSDPRDLAEQARAFRDAELHLLQDTFEQEPRDASWAATAIQQIGKAYAAPDLAGVTVEPDCKSTLCRLELRFQSADDASRLAQQLSLRTPWPGAGYVHFDADTLRGVYYLTRQDHPLATASLPAP